MALKNDEKKSTPKGSGTTSAPGVSATTKPSDLSKICNRGCVNIPANLSGAEHTAVCPIANRYVCRFCLHRAMHTEAIERHAEDTNDWDKENDPTCFVKDSRAVESILKDPSSVPGYSKLHIKPAPAPLMAIARRPSPALDSPPHFLENCVPPTGRKRLSSGEETPEPPHRFGDAPNSTAEITLLKEHIGIMVNQMAELVQTVRFQERLIDRLMVYLPTSASVSNEYVPAPAPTLAPVPVPVYIPTTITKSKPVVRSLSSDTVVERVELGLPRESELREWREETKSKMNPSTSKKTNTSTATRPREYTRRQDERSNDKSRTDLHRFRSRNPRGYVPRKRSHSTERQTRSLTPEADPLIEVLLQRLRG